MYSRLISLWLHLLTNRVVGVNSNTEAKFFAQVPPAFLELGAEHFTRWGSRRPLTGDASGQKIVYYIMLGFGNARDLISFMALLTLGLLLLPLVAASACVGLSIFRLVIITRHKYEGGSDGGSNSNVLRALIFFYALVLAQGGLFLVWLRILSYRLEARDRVCSQYLFEGMDKKQLIDKYINRTSSACIKTGVLNTINRKLVTFAVDLLQSEYSQDRISGVLLLHTLTSKDAPKAHKARALAHIQSSPDCISRMLALLSSKSAIDEASKVRLAQIVALLASDLRLSDIDRATESISSLLDPYLVKISTTANSVSNGQQITIEVGNGQQARNQSPNTPDGENSIPLIIHGLMILAKLAGNPDNCSKIYETKSLFSKITVPVSNKMYKVFSHDDTAIQIAKHSLQVLSKLVKGADEINRNILQEIHRTEFEAKSIRPILRDDQRYNELKVPAIKILTKQALANTTRDTVGDEAMVNFINSLIGLFFNDHNESHLRKTAGKALALLAIASTSYCATIMNGSTGTADSVVRKLSDMLADRSNKSYRTAIAQLLRQFCIGCCDDQREHLASAKTILHEVLKVICDVDQEVETNQSDSPQHNPSRGLVILQFCLPCIDTSSFPSRSNQGGHNQRPATALQYLLSCLGTSSPATRHDHRERNRNTTPQAPGSRNERREGHNQGMVQGILSAALQVINRFVNVPMIYHADRHNRNIHSDNVQYHQLADAPIEPGRRKALVAFLGLAVQMCERLIDASDFDAAVLQIPLSEAEVVEKLKEIIEICIKDSVGPSMGKGPSVDYLVMIQSVTKLCTWVMRTKPGYVRFFQEKNVGHKLKDAEETMRGLELAVLLTSSIDEMTNYETLSSIVGDARTLIPSQHPNMPM
ncbi:hypothetical protein PAHAL_5G473000 [Panicum hallii]|uniref:DUF4042 domain-containing protein n=1 Tax=Panicum hallii TaxID=206008 RepID=A0A2T8INU4_9POAL|nr:hypothetical protein PAHAL_5G473000 [Panicum hallii]